MGSASLNQELQMRRIHNPAHPGAVPQEYLPEGMKVTEAAGRLRSVAGQATTAAPRRQTSRLILPGDNALLGVQGAAVKRCGSAFDT